MNVHLSGRSLYLYGGIALVGFALFLLFWLAGTDGTSLARLRARYTNSLDASLRLLFLGGSGRIILAVQIVLIVAICAVESLVGDVIPYWYVLVIFAAFGPAAYLWAEKSKRISELEAQVDGFILTLSNALRTVPSPGAALQGVVPFLPNPIRQELERVGKEMRVGNTLDQALMNMSARIGSRQLDTAITSVLVGIQVGGNLPSVLETTAGTIRDMRRLEGVVRSKTGEARAQLWVLAAFPFIICATFNSVSPGYFEPLQTTLGLIVVGVAATFWVGSLIIARQVLGVDI